MNKELLKINTQKRTGLVDCWNAYMVQGASFSSHGIPKCPTTITEAPNNLIGFDEAKTIHNKETKAGKSAYHVNSFIHFFIDDQKFDGPRNSIWIHPQKALDIIRHFDGIICPDFSTYNDFPDPLRRYNYYRMNAFGYWVSAMGIPVISCLRWGPTETFDYCFDGNPQNSILAIGTVASGLRYKPNYLLFEQGLSTAVEVLHPHTLLVYGSANYPCFESLKSSGITIISKLSKKNKVYGNGVR